MMERRQRSFGLVRLPVCVCVRVCVCVCLHLVLSSAVETPRLTIPHLNALRLADKSVSSDGMAGGGSLSSSDSDSDPHLFFDFDATTLADLDTYAAAQM